MNKKIVISLVLMLALTLSACGKKEETVSKNKEVKQKIENLERNSLVDWLRGDKTVECTIQSEGGDIVVTTKGDSSYMEEIPFMSPDSQGEMPKAGNGAMLTIGDWTYMWDKETKKGTKMNMKEMEEFTEENEEGIEEEDDQVGKMAEQWEDSGFEYDCKEVKVDESLFREPKDIEFNDLSEKMREFNESSKKIQEQAEAGEEIDMEELEKMMKGL